MWLQHHINVGLAIKWHSCSLVVRSFFVYRKTPEVASIKGLQRHFTKKISFPIPWFNILWTEVWSYDLKHKALKSLALVYKCIGYKNSPNLILNPAVITDLMTSCGNKLHRLNKGNLRSTSVYCITFTYWGWCEQGREEQGSSFLEEKIELITFQWL